MTNESSDRHRSTALSYEVTTADVAAAVGSGDVPVLATPRLLTWCEAATVREAERSGSLPAGSTSVGTRVELDHLVATPVGGRVRVTAWLAEVRGNTLVFEVSAIDRGERVVASGVVHRAVVDRERFLSRVPAP
jgi:predicted thioesterase